MANQVGVALDNRHLLEGFQGVCIGRNLLRVQASLFDLLKIGGGGENDKAALESDLLGHRPLALVYHDLILEEMLLPLVVPVHHLSFYFSQDCFDAIVFFRAVLTNVFRNLLELCEELLLTLQISQCLEL